jgi:glycosyltransferase involved in cell wall biosynthesis
MPGTRPLRLLVFSQHYWPESFRINDVVDSLRAVGCGVEVLTGQPNYPDGRIFSGYRAWNCGSAPHPNGYLIHRVPLVPRRRGGALRLAANYLSFMLTSATLGPWLLRRRRIDVVFVYGTSPILQAIGAIAIARFHRARLVAWVQDLWPQSLEVTGYVRNRRVLAAVAVAVRWIYRRCDLLLVQSEAFAPTVRAMSGGTPVAVQPNPGEASFERPPQGPPALKLPPGFNVVFAGNLGSAQALDTVLAAAECLRDLPDMHIVLVGSGARADWLAGEVARRALGNVRLPGRFPPEAMPGILAQASVLLVTLARSPIMSQTVPSKVQAYLAAGRPIVAGLDGEGARVVEASGAGLAVPAEDPAALAAAIRSLSQQPADRRAAMGAAGVAYYREHFRPDPLARLLLARLEALVQPDSAR